MTKIAAISTAFWKHNSNIIQYSINVIRTPKLLYLVAKCYRNLCTLHINTGKSGLFATSGSSMCMNIILNFILIFFFHLAVL